MKSQRFLKVHFWQIPVWRPLTNFRGMFDNNHRSLSVAIYEQCFSFLYKIYERKGILAFTVISFAKKSLFSVQPIYVCVFACVYVHACACVCVCACVFVCVFSLLVPQQIRKDSATTVTLAFIEKLLMLLSCSQTPSLVIPDPFPPD